MEIKIPPKIKVYEALGCIADNRIKITNEGAEVASTNYGKTYSVKFLEEENKITSTDNGSFWQNYYGYPIIAFLMKIGKIGFNPGVLPAFQKINWAALVVKYKRDYDKVEEEALKIMIGRGFSEEEIKKEADNIFEQLKNLKYSK